ncbi:hypothetical protein CL622_01790 [archaeon]|nr:hypothetical protein [archaeon]|tara:strand:- start:165 stop:593 length:429 start_codon:yes stop_codon:yes gene_type:complete
MIRPYQFFDHTADVLYKANGKDYKEVFTNAGLALMETMVSLKTIEHKKSRKITLTEDSYEKLLFSFLEELVFIKDVNTLLFNKFSITLTEKKDKYTLIAVCHGDKIKPSKQELKVDVKAITLHEFYLKKTKDGYQAKVLVDI